MLNTWFTADTHFYHAKILEYEPIARPFKTIEEMNETLIDRWNAVVRPYDTIWHLGDFCFGRDNLSIAARLNGKKRLILGNHDLFPSNSYLAYFDRLYGMIFWKRCVLSHMPIYHTGLGSRWFLNVHGHLHGKKVMRPDLEGEFAYVDDQNYLCVSVEQNNLTPIHSEIIMERLRELDS